MSAATVIVMLIILHQSDGKQVFTIFSFDDRATCEIAVKAAIDQNTEAFCLNAPKFTMKGTNHE
jgi:hypothetical protein